MVDTIHHGIKNTEATIGVRPILTASSAVIGLVAIAEDADEEVFPLDTAVLITNVRSAIADAGEDGTLKKALEAIADHCSPIIIVVRVAEGADSAGTSTNIVGTTTGDGKLTGMKALLSAYVSLGYRPNILGVPGYDTLTVTTALVAIAAQLDAFVYAKAIGATKAAAITYRAGFSSRNLMPIWPEWSDWDGSAVARALGLRALLDQTVGFHQSISNNPVQGVTGISQDVFWDLSGEGTDAAALNNAQITTLIRHNGYRYWGNRTCSTDTRFAFEVAARTGQVIRRTIAEAQAEFTDKPMSAALVKTIIDSVNAKFESLRTEGKIMGARCWYDGEINNATELSGGKLALDYEYTTVAPLESLTNYEHITDKYYLNFGDQIAALG